MACLVVFKKCGVSIIHFSSHLSVLTPLATARRKMDCGKKWILKEPAKSPAQPAKLKTALTMNLLLSTTHIKIRRMRVLSRGYAVSYRMTLCTNVFCKVSAFPSMISNYTIFKCHTSSYPRHRWMRYRRCTEQLGSMQFESVPD